MKRPITGLLLSSLLLLTTAFPALASQHGNTGHPGSQGPPARNAAHGLERATEQRAEQAGDHGMEALGKQRQHMEYKGTKESDKAREKMQHRNKMQQTKDEALQEADKGKYQDREKLRDKEAMEHKDREKIQQRIRDKETAESAEDRPRKRRWYWPFGDAE